METRRWCWIRPGGLQVAQAAGRQAGRPAGRQAGRQSGVLDEGERGGFNCRARLLDRGKAVGKRGKEGGKGSWTGVSQYLSLVSHRQQGAALTCYDDMSIKIETSDADPPSPAKPAVAALQRVLQHRRPSNPEMAHRLGLAHPQVGRHMVSFWSS